MAFYWIQSAYNLSDMLSKHWDHPTVYPMILKLLVTRGNITLIPKEANQEKEKENLKLQEGRNRKISMIFPLVSCCSCVNNISSSKK